MARRIDPSNPLSSVARPAGETRVAKIANIVSEVKVWMPLQERVGVVHSKKKGYLAHEVRRRYE